MAKKHLKKFQDMCRKNVREGLGLKPDGTWGKTPENSMLRDMRGGYKMEGRNG